MIHQGPQGGRGQQSLQRIGLTGGQKIIQRLAEVRQDRRGHVTGSQGQLARQAQERSHVHRAKTQHRFTQQGIIQQQFQRSAQRLDVIEFLQCPQRGQQKYRGLRGGCVREQQCTRPLRRTGLMPTQKHAADVSGDRIAGFIGHGSQRLAQPVMFKRADNPGSLRSVKTAQVKGMQGLLGQRRVCNKVHGNS